MMEVEWYGGPRDGEILVLPDDADLCQIEIGPSLVPLQAVEDLQAIRVRTFAVPVEPYDGGHRLVWARRWEVT